MTHLEKLLWGWACHLCDPLPIMGAVYILALITLWDWTGWDWRQRVHSDTNYLIRETLNPWAGPPSYSMHYSHNLDVFLPCLRIWADIQLVLWTMLALHPDPLKFYSSPQINGVQPLTFLCFCLQAAPVALVRRTSWAAPGGALLCSVSSQDSP